MNLATCILSLIPLRANKSHKSEMISQILYGELFTVLEVDNDWSYIKTQENSYEGWLQNNQFEYILSYDSDLKPYKIVNLDQASIVSGKSSIKLLHGTPIHSEATNELEINGLLRIPTLLDFEIEFPRLVDYYLHTPYFWGGRSVFGIDCSGLTQLIFRHFGIIIPRDAWQQALEGSTVDFVSEAKAGDLAFFDNDEGRITHVGILIDADTIFHASTRVKIDKFDTEGIFNQDTGQYSHKFRIMKRYF